MVGVVASTTAMALTTLTTQTGDASVPLLDGAPNGCSQQPMFFAVEDVDWVRKKSGRGMGWFYSTAQLSHPGSTFFEPISHLSVTHKATLSPPLSE